MDPPRSAAAIGSVCPREHRVLSGRGSRDQTPVGSDSWQGGALSENEKGLPHALVASSDALVASSFLFLVAMPGATSSF